MRKVIVLAFVTLEKVMQAGGSPGEDGELKSGAAGEGEIK
jgi:hypothetical protein